MYKYDYSISGHFWKPGPHKQTESRLQTVFSLVYAIIKPA